jgi:hypothetical protein
VANSLHLRNTWDCLEKIKQQHDSDLKDEHTHSSYLENAYVRAEGKRNAMLMAKLGEDDRTTIEEWGGSPLDAFLGLIKTGGYPPPELMLIVADAFEYYFEQRGAVPLEHIFFGREVPKAGNESARRKNHRVFEMFTTWSESNLRSEAKMSQVKLAEKLIAAAKKYHLVEPDFVEDPESFIKRWRRWKNADK